MGVFGKLIYYKNLYSNIRNVPEYRKNRKRRDVRPLQFITRPGIIHFTVSFAMYSVFKEVFLWDVYQIRKLIKQIPSNALVVDVGANCGFFDVLLLSKLQDVNILAFEPLAINVEIINTTLNRNPVMRRQMKLFAEAVTGNVNGELELYVETSGENSEIASVFANFDERNTEKIAVPCRSLAQIIKDENLQNIDLLKMDCEGSEFDILYNTLPEDFRKIKHMAIEVHNQDTERHNLQSLIKFLNQLGFTTKFLPLQNRCYYLQASQL